MQRRLSLLLIFVIATHSISLHSQPSCWERARTAFTVFGVIAGVVALLSCVAKPLAAKPLKRTPKESNTPRNDVLVLSDPNSDELVLRRTPIEYKSGGPALVMLDRGYRCPFNLDTLQYQWMGNQRIQIQSLDEDAPDAWGIGIFDERLKATGAISLRGIPEGIFAISETIFVIFYRNKPFVSIYDLKDRVLVRDIAINGFVKMIRPYDERIYVIFETPECDVVHAYQRQPFRLIAEIPVERGRITDFYVENGIIWVLYDGRSFRIFGETPVLTGCCLRSIPLGELSKKVLKFRRQDDNIIFMHEDGTKTVQQIKLLMGANAGTT